MHSHRTRICIAGLLLLGASRAWADGGMFLPREVAASIAATLAQTRQEVVLAVHPLESTAAPTAAGSAQTAVTYVLRTHFRGEPTALAWVIPVPDTPTNVLAHEDARLFERLDLMTSPRFSILEPPAPRRGCGCAATGGMAGPPGELVEVEARGTAGIFDWAALTSSGADALLTWLDDNGFEVPAEAAPILDDYIAQDMHFLAVRVNEAGEAGDDAGPIEIPPLQFTVSGARVFYPMAISRVTAADPTEVLVYLLGDHRMEAANLPNGVIDPVALVYDPNSPSLTNYEVLFTETLADLGGAALITEYAGYVPYSELIDVWPDGPLGTYMPAVLTRMRTVLPRSQMNQDFEFQVAETDDPVSNNFSILRTETEVAGLLGPPAVVAAGYGLFARWLKRRAQLRRRIDSGQ
jgi:hypothetical protein